MPTTLAKATPEHPPETAVTASTFTPELGCRAARDQLFGHAGAGVRPGPGGGGPLAPDRDPAPDERRVSSRGDAQLGDLPVPAGVLPALAEAERGAGAFGQQVGAPGGGLLQFGDRRGLLLGGEPGLGVPGGGAGDLSVPETVRIRARHHGRIEAVFYSGQGARSPACKVTHVRR